MDTPAYILAASLFGSFLSQAKSFKSYNRGVCTPSRFGGIRADIVLGYSHHLKRPHCIQIPSARS